MDLKTLLDQIKEAEAEVIQEEQLLFKTPQLTATHYAILKILEEQPILIQPTLKWLQNKQAQLAATQLLALYSIEDIKAMYSQDEWEIFKQKYNIIGV